MFEIVQKLPRMASLLLQSFPYTHDLFACYKLTDDDLHLEGFKLLWNCSLRVFFSARAHEFPGDGNLYIPKSVIDDYVKDELTFV